MEFFVSWYPGDPDYPSYDDDCAMLVSVASVPQSWTLDHFTIPPRRLIVDSGGYRFAKFPRESLPPEDLFKRQQSILGHRQVEAIICARDYPILNPSATTNEKDACITQTIAYAYEFKQLTQKYPFPSYWRTMAVIQGYDENSLIYCARELQRIGFDLYGIGSMAILKRQEPILRRVKAVASVVDPKNLHVFGVSVIEAGQCFRKMGIHSIDSARPAKAAAYNEVLYSNPYRRFGILEPQNIPMVGRIPKHRRLSEPLPCACPVCREGGSEILGVGKRRYIRARALHNYYHLKRIFTKQGF